MIKKSLAGTNKNYVDLRGACWSGELHIQGKGHKANRDYGISFTFKNIPQGLKQIIKTLQDSAIQHGTLCSLTGSGTKYFCLQARARKDGTINVQVQCGNKLGETGNSVGNREYGYAKNFLNEGVDFTNLYNWLKEEQKGDE
tara:strand:- start:10015 stop:10440 length:426 start_codon:yes stop_codon:yes gene_type:complete